MAFENLFIRTQRSIAGIKLDAVLSESHAHAVTKTKNPVEFGAEVTDHATIEPVVVTIVGEVSDTPLGAAAFGELIDPISDLFGAATENKNEYTTRSQAAYRQLIDIKNKREPVEIQTKLITYPRMIITNVTTSQDVNSSRSVTLNITAEELFIAESETITISEDVLNDLSTTQQAASETDRGRQEANQVLDEVKQSFLKVITDFIGVTEEGSGVQP